MITYIVTYNGLLGIQEFINQSINVIHNQSSIQAINRRYKITKKIFKKPHQDHHQKDQKVTCSFY